MTAFNLFGGGFTMDVCRRLAMATASMLVVALGGTHCGSDDGGVAADGAGGAGATAGSSGAGGAAAASGAAGVVGGSGGAVAGGGAGGSAGTVAGGAGGSSGSAGVAGGTGGVAGSAGSDASAGASGASGAAGAGGGSDAGTEGGGPVASKTCTAPIGLVNTATPTKVIGTGTPASCTEADLRTAAAAGGIITFNCGPNPATIALTDTLTLPTTKDTVIDGGGKITLDAGKKARHFYFYSANFMATTTKVVLQRLVLRNGKAPAGQFFPQSTTTPKCAWGYKEGSGGAIYMRDGVLQVIDCEFYDNEAALKGPDVGGGAIYAVGAKGVTIVNSRFVGNRASNGGAVGMLFANPQIYNSVFENNTAEGIGMNYVEAGCPMFGHDGQGGAGGLAGAVYFDGMNDDGFVYTICGSVFRNNRCNELAGALFRTPNVSVRQMLIDRSTFDGNTAKMGGVSFIKQNDLTVKDTLFANNRGGVDITGAAIQGNSGGLWVNEGSLSLTNSTFANNSPGGLSIELYAGAAATVKNATFVDSGSAANITAYNSVFVRASCETANGTKNVQWPQSGTCPADTVRADPKLAALADNGGPTLTMMPAADSSVLGIGTACPATDQRGQPRAATGCDTGAVER
jgi:hypothetical protein